MVVQKMKQEVYAYDIDCGFRRSGGRVFYRFGQAPV